MDSESDDDIILVNGLLASLITIKKFEMNRPQALPISTSASDSSCFAGTDALTSKCVCCLTGFSPPISKLQPVHLNSDVPGRRDPTNKEINAQQPLTLSSDQG